ncbi:MAG: histone deacetylase [Bacteroidales bacterium]|jgi:acetoin utilization deacetylase AcuC-like enzyme|nr:histone deacetylase [Bacteroidales bacterium]
MKKTAYLYDPIYMSHDTGQGHPECPERLMHIHSKIQSSTYFKNLLLVEPCNASFSDIELIHTRAYIKRVQKEIESNTEFLDSIDTVVCRDSFDIAIKAVGGCLALCNMVMDGKAQNGFCAVRPPGHHAEKDYAAGFCIFNNIAIAAKYIQQKHSIKKVAIMDWDVHHGNGSQHSFYNDDTVLYISTHQMPLYPGTGAENDRGSGKGEGYTLNIAMNPGSGNAEMQDAFDDIIIPALDSFQPEVLLVSAGFDAHKSDPLASLKLTTDMYYNMAKMLKESAEKHSKGRIICFLEGGYNLTALANSVDKVMQAFSE